MAKRRWIVRLADAAADDHDQIIAWTLQQFGARQAKTCARTLSLAIQHLSGGPEQPGLRARPEIGADLLTLHVARAGRRGRHVLLLRHSNGSAVIDVLRILHDAMDLPQPPPD